jgi:hypothetical protein
VPRASAAPATAELTSMPILGWAPERNELLDLRAPNLGGVGEHPYFIPQHGCCSIR